MLEGEQKTGTSQVQTEQVLFMNIDAIMQFEWQEIFPILLS